MATTKTNAQIDILAAAIPTPFGPLTRVTDFEDTANMPVPNSDVRGAFTSALSETVYFSPDELANLGLMNQRLYELHDWSGVVADMIVKITALYTLAAAMSTPHTYEDYKSLMDYIKENFHWSMGVVSAIPD